MEIYCEQYNGEIPVIYANILDELAGKQIRILSSKRFIHKENMMDKFLIWLKDSNTDYRKIALTDNSYKIEEQRINHHVSEIRTNKKYATCGDALLKFILCEIFYDKDKDVESITEKKKNYESDRALVVNIASHYHIPEHLRFDKNDVKLPQDYNYYSTPKSNKNPHKYIATAVEACIWGFYLDNKRKMDVTQKTVEYWMSLIDRR